MRGPRSTDWPIEHRSFCVCGGTLSVTLDPFAETYDLVEGWEALHSGGGHGRCDAKKAAKARHLARQRGRAAAERERQEGYRLRREQRDLEASVGIDPFRTYGRPGKDGYPPEWHATVKDLVRDQAGHRCVRCHHPYIVGQNGKGEWSRCDRDCIHDGPVRYFDGEWHKADPERVPVGAYTEAHWRILTVHHLDGVKTNCRWWNLVALCQRCHLEIQGKVKLERHWQREHSDWFKPYVAGYYASFFLGEELTREETMTRLDELLALEDRQLEVAAAEDSEGVLFS